MATTSFPTNLDTLPNTATLSTAGRTLANTDGSNTHGDLIGWMCDAIEALEAKVGINNSAVTTSLDYKLNNAFDLVGSYTPTFQIEGTSPVVQPNLGTTGSTYGVYATFGQVMFVIAGLQFSGTGCSGGSVGGGSGVYNFSVPAGTTCIPAYGGYGDYQVGHGLLGQFLGIRDLPVAVYIVNPETTPLLRFVTGTSATTGTTTVTSGTQSVVVTHNLGLNPTVNITPTSSSATSQMVRWWVDTLTATQFTLHAQASGGNLAGNQTFSWNACQEASGTMTWANPWPIGLGGDHMRFQCMLPLA